MVSTVVDRDGRSPRTADVARAQLPAADDSGEEKRDARVGR